jgi:hypothetical protein
LQRVTFMAVHSRFQNREQGGPARFELHGRRRSTRASHGRSTNRNTTPLRTRSQQRLLRSFDLAAKLKQLGACGRGRHPVVLVVHFNQIRPAFHVDLQAGQRIPGATVVFGHELGFSELQAQAKSPVEADAAGL